MNTDCPKLCPELYIAQNSETSTLKTKKLGILSGEKFSLFKFVFKNLMTIGTALWISS